MTHDELRALLSSWTLALRSENKSAKTIRSYGEGVTQFGNYCLANGLQPDLSRENVRGFINYLLNDRGLEPTTALTRQAPLRLFSAWLADEGEIERDDLLGMKRVKLDIKVVPSLSDDEIERLLKVCGNGKSKQFVDIRDYAIVRFMLDSTCRADETISMRYPADLNINDGTAVVRRGKGGKGRVIGFNYNTASALDKYLRRRRQHPRAESSALWLGDKGQGFTYAALYKALKRRGSDAGLEDFHPHILRHTAASQWLDAGGSEGSLMAKAGWSNRSMLDRYVKSTSERRAIEETRQLDVMGKFS